MASKQLNTTQAIISTVLRPERTLLRIGAALAIAGIALLTLASFLHPSQADPGNSMAAFQEYAAATSGSQPTLLSSSARSLSLAP